MNWKALCFFTNLSKFTRMFYLLNKLQMFFYQRKQSPFNPKVLNCGSQVPPTGHFIRISLSCAGILYQCTVNGLVFASYFTQQKFQKHGLLGVHELRNTALTLKLKEDKLLHNSTALCISQATSQDNITDFENVVLVTFSLILALRSQ